MRILITGATGNVGKGMIPLLRAAGHDLVLSDLPRAPETDAYRGLPYHQLDIQHGFGLDRAAAGCEMILHLPAWHGIHWRDKTEADYWRLNIDGTFWMFQAAQAHKIKRVVFLSSQAWHGHYDKYGFTKRIGEELCEYNRVRHAIRYAAIRPAGFVPWDDYLRRGVDFLYGAVHRNDVIQCIARSIEILVKPNVGEAEKIIVDAVRPNGFTAAQIENWTSDPLGTCERIFPNSRGLIEKYSLDIKRKPELSSEGAGGELIGWKPLYHFGTFIEELRALDLRGGDPLVKAQRCEY